MTRLLGPADPWIAAALPRGRASVAAVHDTAPLPERYDQRPRGQTAKMPVERPLEGEWLHRASLSTRMLTPALSAAIEATVPVDPLRFSSSGARYYTAVEQASITTPARGVFLDLYA